MHVVVVGVHIGGTKQLMWDLELCPSCKLAWLDHHLHYRAPGRRSYHETKLRDAELKPADYSDLATVKAWSTRSDVGPVSTRGSEVLVGDRLQGRQTVAWSARSASTSSPAGAASTGGRGAASAGSGAA